MGRGGHDRVPRPPQGWWTRLGAAKAAGAAGLLLGLFVPVIGAVAAVALVLYFTGAVITVIRARSYAHIPFPLLYAAPRHRRPRPHRLSPGGRGVTGRS
ncbi:hypothetical protein GCM10020254_48070 [Streptomyces goshikiensis]